MTEQEFLKDFHRLEGGFPFLSRNVEDRKAREAAYWSVIHRYSAQCWRQAVTMILENWTEETFPVPYTVKSYLESEQQRTRGRTPQNDCAKCDGTGWKPYEANGVRRVRICECVKMAVADKV